jgi:hypothetical protein
MKCPYCGDECREETPLSAMGYPMYGRGVDDYICTNLRCSHFGEVVG